MGIQLPSLKQGAEPPPNFRPIYCGQTAGCIKMPLATDVGLGLRDIVFDLTQLSPEKGHTHPTQFLAHVYCGQMAGWMKSEDAAWYGSRPRPRPHCTRRGPSSRKTGTAAPSFRPMSIVATVTHLSYCWALFSDILLMAILAVDPHRRR